MTGGDLAWVLYLLGVVINLGFSEAISQLMNRKFGDVATLVFAVCWPFLGVIMAILVVISEKRNGKRKDP